MVATFVIKWTRQLARHAWFLGNEAPFAANISYGKFVSIQTILRQQTKRFRSHNFPDKANLGPLGSHQLKILPIAQRARGLSSAYQSNLFRSYHKIKHKSWSNIIWGISTKHQLQNLNQTSASRLNLKFKILSKPSFRISTKIQIHDLYKTSATKYWPNSSFRSCLNFNFKILTKPCAQSLNKSLAFWPILSFHIWNKLLPTWSSSSTSATVLSWHLHTPRSHQSSLLNVTESVSYWQAFPMIGLGSDKKGGKNEILHIFFCLSARKLAVDQGWKYGERVSVIT